MALDSARGDFETGGNEPVDPDVGPQFFLPPTSGTAPNGLPYLNWDQVALQLTRSHQTWVTPGSPLVITYAYRSTAPAVMPGDTAGFSRFNDAQIAATEEALKLWADVANITFNRITDVGSNYSNSNSATIVFSNYSSGEDGAAAFANLPGFNLGAGDVWVNSSLSYNANPVFGDYGPLTLLHEIGHALGLSHPGDYNAGDGGGDITYPEDAVYFQDSRMYTVMSYFGSSGVGGSLDAFSNGPQLHDIAAIQYLYGANTTTRLGNTIYGFNNNTGHDHYGIPTDTQFGPVFSIWDAGGNDTLDLSGYNTNSEIDLRPEFFSSAGPGNSGIGVAVGNISIARGVIIENAIGGGGNDTMFGNDVANTLTGNGGNDTIDGGLGADTMNGGAGDDTYIVDNAGDSIVEGAGGGADQVNAAFSYTLGAEIENLTLTGASAINGTGNSLANVITGNDQANVIAGLGGADTINAAGGNDTINYTLGDGADSVDGGAGADTFALSGTGGDDQLSVTWNGSAITSLVGVSLTSIEQINVDLGGGADTLVYSGATGATVDLGASTASGFNTIAGIENVTGGSGNDTITGNDSANVLAGGVGVDTISAAGGNDTVNYTMGDGADLIDGGLGTDTLAIVGTGGDDQLVLSWSGVAITGVAGGTLAGIEQISVDLGGGVNALIYSGSSAVTVDLSAASASGITTLANIENLTGGGGNDVITGDALANLLDGAVGNDFLSGGLGADTLFGRAGADTLNGGGGADTMFGGDGDDVYFVDNAGDVTTDNGALGGIDTVQAAIGWTLGTAMENLTLLGSVISGTGNELGNVITGNAAANILSGKAGADGILAGDGNDTLFGGDGNDSLSGQNDNDLLDAGNNNDALDGGAGTDTLFGRAGIDTLDGGTGADTMFGGDGDDTYYVDDAGDVIGESASAGIDLIYSSVTRSLGQYQENLTLTGAFAIDGVGNVLNNVIIGNEFANTLSGLGGADSLSGNGGVDALNGGNGDDTLSGGAGGDTLDGGNDNDTLSGGDDADTLYGRTGTDTLNGDAGNDTLYGGDGDDSLHGGDDGDLLDGGNHNDSLFGDAGDDTLYGRQDNDTLQGGDGADTVYGGDGDDLLHGNNDADHLEGGNGADAMFGDAGDDMLLAQAGNDTLDGGAGNDTLSGGGGDDMFSFAPGSGADHDVITDFVAGGTEDTLDLSAFNGSGVTWTIAQDGVDTVFSFSNGDTLSLTNVNSNNLVVIDPWHYG